MAAKYREQMLNKLGIKIAEFDSGTFANEIPIVTNPNDFVRLALFHAYDGELSTKYGANDADVLQIISENTQLFHDIEVITGFGANSSQNYYIAAKKVWNFLSGSIAKPHLLFSLGTPLHSTKMLLTRYPLYFQVAYINTGEGVSPLLYTAHNIGTQTYFDLLKVAVVINERAAEFCNALLPFLYAKLLVSPKILAQMGSKVQQKEVYVFAMTDRIVNYLPPVSSTIMGFTASDYFEKVYDRLFPFPYEATLSLLRGFNGLPQPGPSVALLTSFVQHWRTMDILDVEAAAPSTLSQYFNKAHDNMGFTIVGKELYVKPQRSGTCTFLSTVLAALVKCMYAPVSDVPGFIKFYFDITVLGHETLQTYKFKSLDTANTTSGPIVIQKLLQDGCITDSNPYFATVQQENAAFNVFGLPASAGAGNQRCFHRMSEAVLQGLVDQIRLKQSWDVIAPQVKTIINANTAAAVAKGCATPQFWYYLDVIVLFLLHKMYTAQSVHGVAGSSNVLNFLRFNATEDEHLWMQNLLSPIIFQDTNDIVKTWLEEGVALVFDKPTDKALILAALKEVVQETKHFVYSFYTFLQDTVLGSKIVGNQSKDAVMPVNVTYASTYTMAYLQQLDANSEVFTNFKKIFSIENMVLCMYNYMDDELLTRLVGYLIGAYLRLENDPENPLNLPQMMLMINLIPLVNSSSCMTSNGPLVCMSRNSADLHFRKVFLKSSLPRDLAMVRACMHNGVVNMDEIKALDFIKGRGISNPALRVQPNGEVHYVKPDGSGTFSCQEIVGKLNHKFGGTYASLMSVATMFYCIDLNLLLFLLPEWKYQSDLYAGEDWLVAVQISTPATSTVTFAPGAEAAINQEKVLGFLSPAHTAAERAAQLSRFPFLASMPQTCMIFVVENYDTNAYSVYLLQHNMEVGCFSGAIFNDDVYQNKHFRLTVSIKNNFLLPDLTPAETNVFDLMTANTAGSLVSAMNIPGPRDPGVAKLTPRAYSTLDIVPTWGSVFELARSSVEPGTAAKFTPSWFAKICAAVISAEPGKIMQEINARVATVLPEIHRRYKHCVLVRTDLCTKINWNAPNLFTLLTKNADVLLQLLQCNTYILTLTRMKTLLKAWQQSHCDELLELDQLLLDAVITMKQPKTPVDAAFEIVFGNIIRAEQWIKYNELVADYNTKTCRVFQFMMGKGKSSVITPMLLHYIYRSNTDAVLHSVVPAHLTTQTTNTLKPFAKNLGLSVSVVTDTDVKRALLCVRNAGLVQMPAAHTASVVFSDDSVFLFDEIDDMYDASKSTLNIVQRQHILPTDIAAAGFAFGVQVLAAEAAGLVVTASNRFEQDFLEIMKNTSLKRNMHYGMSKSKPLQRFAIPYEKRVDSPMEGSQFSAALYTLVLTLRYFWRGHSFCLETKDVLKICENNSPLMVRLATEWGVGLSRQESPAMTLVKTLKTHGGNVSNDFMQTYFHVIMLDVNVPDAVYNCSFVDTMNVSKRHAAWLVGYSGTVNMNLGVTTSQRFVSGVVPDPDEASGVAKALAQANVVVIHDPNMPKETASAGLEPEAEEIPDVWDIVNANNYTAVIDACALFEGMDNKEVAKKLLATAQGNGVKEVIYLTSDDVPMSYFETGAVPYTKHSRAPGSVLYFYSQRHIVGIDLPQPPILKGLLLLGPQSTRTQAAQAMFRLRKLNRGHTIDVGACFGAVFRLTDVLLPLVKAEARENKNTQTMLYVQYVKYLYRRLQLAKKNPYAEVFPDEFAYDAEEDTRVTRTLIIDKLKTVLHASKLDKFSAAVVNIFLNKNFGERKRAYRVLFNKSNTACTDTVLSVSVSTSVATNTNVNRVAFELARESLNIKVPVWTYKWWTKEQPVNMADRFLFTITNSHGDRVHFSQNLCGIHKSMDSSAILERHGKPMVYPRGFVLVQLSLHTYLMESVETLPNYLVCGFPLVDVSTGRVINNFPLFLERIHGNVDVGALLHVHCVNEAQSAADVLKVNHLFSVHTPDTPPAIQILKDQEFGMLSYLFAQFFENEEMKPTVANLPCLTLAVTTLSSKKGKYERAFVDFINVTTLSQCEMSCTTSNQCLRDLYGPLEVTETHPVYRQSTCVVNGKTNYRAIVSMNALKEESSAAGSASGATKKRPVVSDDSDEPPQSQRFKPTTGF
jgi:hypothetical protein